ncbi:hypothetical protein FE257_008659 [Aspergillus nanangensis]|uniref:Uncharacterized protein n=1 Tax=Aspergillus nanangensis TaxID=2582783 RepID=A0AAD4CKX8_ASPNN|nr:hypothetical protein FE257_008659 [Aspergillus nanangensis]
MSSNPRMYMSNGEVLSSPPLLVRASRFVEDIYMFFGLYLVSFFSLDAYTAAENSQFNAPADQAVVDQAADPREELDVWMMCEGRSVKAVVNMRETGRGSLFDPADEVGMEFTCDGVERQPDRIWVDETEHSKYYENCTPCPPSILHL